MTQGDFGKKLDNIVRQYDLLRHPFYKAWMEGALTRDDIREYSMDYYHQVAAFPKYLRELARRLPPGELRHEIYQNLCEEEGHTGGDDRSHAAIWIIFAEEMGADTATMGNRAPLPKTRQLIDIFFELAQSGSEAEALAAFYAYESQVPALAAHKAAALRNTYGVRDAACEYFILHTTADIRHASVWRDHLLRIVDGDPSVATHAIVACELAAKALWRALDGINARRNYLDYES